MECTKDHSPARKRIALEGDRDDDSTCSSPGSPTNSSANTVRFEMTLKHYEGFNSEYQVLTSGRLSEKFISTLRTLTGSDEKENAQDCRFHILPGKDYQYEACRSRVLSLRLPGAPDDDDAQLTYVHSLIDMTAESTVYALGGLLGFLDRCWCDINLDVTERKAPVLAINVISLDDLMFMDQDSFSALQVFCPQAHPSGFKRWSPGNSKEGLSIYGLFNRCRSTLGCKWMKVMFLHPSRDMKLLNERLDMVEFCMRQKNMDVLQQMLEAQEEEIVLFRQIADCLTDELYQVGQSINTFMDFDESEIQNRFVVKPGIDSELDRKKQRHAGLTELLSAVAQQELAALPPCITQCSVVYIPEIGYLLGVPMWLENMKEDEFQLPGLDFIFKSSDVLHYKSARCRELDEVLGDSLVHISKHEARIMVRLVQFVQARVHPIARIINLLAQLDGLAAMAAVAKEHGYVRPILTEDREIEIREGRHPLQELCVSEFVPNDTESMNGGLHILTGPNASGKSVYLKQVALIVYLAQIGSFVPARSAKIGLVDKIFTRIQTNESVSTRLSAFMIDLRQMSLALTSSSPRSLLVVDEFGKGTSELDGLSLLAASLSSLLERGNDLCPLVLVSTHFHHVVELLPASPLVHQQTLEHMCDEEGQIVYLFKLKEGLVNSSFAHQVAQSQGLSQPLLQRSKQNNDNVERIPRSNIDRRIVRHEELSKRFLSMDLNDKFTCQVGLLQLLKELKEL
ncbi:hypothetical protein B566_EDAN010627 [Ephemera danica]|nr:hypothetical protein B566_EDAN010627 [Ephemera danica]